tara:strand:- start:773 stop:1276 length:504 start_codon:yes stop_codon:yes gene_type:complete
MKITNITKSSSKLSQEIRLPLRKRGGINFTVVLKPGDSIFLEEINNNNIIRIYEKKRYLSTSNDKPHSSQSYYVVYTEAALNNLKESEPTNVKVLIKEEDVYAVEKSSTASLDEPSESLEVEIEVVVPEGSINTSKGGRPKGSKNKSKRGRPKSKKSVGRPKKTSKK